MDRMLEASVTLNLLDYTYHLPDDRIAQYPSEQRSGSKLLCYRQGKISHHHFNDLTHLLKTNSHLVFNDTKVIPARLIFRKPTGALIEIFLLKPVSSVAEISGAMVATGSCSWTCLIGNLKRWQTETALVATVPLAGANLEISATLLDKEKQVVRFEWGDVTITFAEVVNAIGQIPLPPYLDRPPEAIDTQRYQTVYSKISGAVAAPTAGLHFTPESIDSLQQAGHSVDYLTLHVGAGTFQPIKTDNVLKHTMHSEQVVVSKSNIKNLINKTLTIAVGTTSLRTLESLYWYGVKLLHQGDCDFCIEQMLPYQISKKELPSSIEALSTILNYMDRRNLNSITGDTRIFIIPGYSFKICKGLITNFHLSKSTLLFLIAAFVGKDWKRIYHEAVVNDYRFLSYGDSSLLLP